MAEADVAVVIGEAVEATDELVDAFARLIPQLSKSNPPPTADHVVELCASPASRVLVARLGGPDAPIVGSLTLVVFRIPTGLRAWIEDVVVDEGASGHRVGEHLSRFAISLAAQLGCTTVDLTSRPSREAANHIYKKIGFELRDTNVYRMELE